ncbi:MAG: Crp/Fnr family transcriptional regulator [Betaproteobacteria bacterium]|nr:Crp/Fnr family transcriptional regulator [Betaproteobacteria bacterium]
MLNPLAPDAAAAFALESAWGRLLTPAQTARVRAEVRERRIPKGSAICHAGSEVQFWKGVMEGLIKMSVVSAEGRHATLTGLASGAWFGEGPVLRSHAWEFDGVALRDTRIALVPRATFVWLLDESPAFARFIIGQLNERLAQFASIIEAERLESAETRVARCLAWLYNPVLYPGVNQELELTQQEIGYLSGVPRQRVNHALKLMQEQNLVRVRYGAVHINDVPGLMAFRTPDREGPLRGLLGSKDT